MQENIVESLKALMEINKMNQRQVAEAANVSQPTISRAIHRGYIRRSEPRNRIENFLKNNASILNKKLKLPIVMACAFREVWDKTDDHAQELAKVIRSLEGMGPRVKPEEHARKISNH